MVAKIITGKSLRGALHYNESKVLEGKATLILASGFAGDIERLNFNQKLHRFENLLMLKPKVRTNTLHISLNFHSAERLTEENLQRIAITYMEKIGFGDQPFLAYRHNDAAHDHIHLVTTNIKADATRINLHNIGANQSEKARKEIEQEFVLVKAQGKLYKPEAGIKIIDVERVVYGKLPTKRAVSNTVNAVIASYKFTSLAELNAVLLQFNVCAFRGLEQSQMFQKKGLVYCLLDDKGEKIGVPIKSSSLYTKPTLLWLERQFPEHEKQRLQFKPQLKQLIDQVLSTKPADRGAFTSALNALGIAAIFRFGVNGQVFGTTFVDHKNKTVFNGSDLGKAYSAKAIMNVLNKETASQVTRTSLPRSTINKQMSTTPNDSKLSDKEILRHSEEPPQFNTGVLEILLKEQYDQSGRPTKKKKRKKLRN